MKIAFTNSGTHEAYAEYQRLAERYGQCQTIEETDVVVAIGGDGHMLDVLQQMSTTNTFRRIYGMNMGTVGYTMNDMSEGCLIERIEAAVPQDIRPLKAKITTTDGWKYKVMAWNEVTVFRQDMQALLVEVSVGDQVRIKDITCDGLIYATPFGSTAYNRSAGGPILPLESRALALTPVCPFRPRNWPGAVLPNKAVVHIRNLDSQKRPMMVTFDSGKRENIATVSISSGGRDKATLLFDPGHGLSDRILAEQFPF